MTIYWVCDGCSGSTELQAGTTRAQALEYWNWNFARHKCGYILKSISK